MENGIDKGGRSRSHRSAVSNGSRLFSLSGGIDGRTSTARRFRDIIETVTSDLGGKDRLSEAQKQLIRRASALSIMCEGVEADLVRDLPFDVANYLQGVGNPWHRARGEGRWHDRIPYNRRPASSADANSIER